jgi:multiple sugar transport system substrate-binding protein
MKAMQGKDKLFLVVPILMAVLLLGACTSTPVATTAAPEPTDEVEPTDAPATDAAPPTDVVVTDEPVAGPLPAVIDMPDEIAGGEPVTITVVQMPPESNPTGLAAWQEQVARFQEMYPNVTIEGTDYAYAPDTFAALVTAGEVPTLFEVYLTDPSKMIDQGVATDLTQFVEDQNLKDVINPKILAIASDDSGKVYGIPRFAYAMGLAYNKEMLSAAGYDAPPATWEEAAEMAVKLTDRDAGVAGLSFITDGSGATGWHATTLGYTFGLKQGDIVSSDGDAYTAGWNNDAMLETLQFIHQLRWENDVLPLENLDWGRNGEALATEKAAMVVMAGDQYTWIRQTFADADMTKFAFAPLPAGPNGSSASLIGGNIAMVYSGATEAEAEAAVYWRLFTQFDPDEIIANYEAGKSDPTVVVGQPVLPLYVGEYMDAWQALEAEYANLPIENYAAFVDAVAAGDVELVPEPLTAGQEYYTAMGQIVSTVLAEESADFDIKALLDEQAGVFQTNVLDMLE